jgi:hypothetical protein
MRKLNLGFFDQLTFTLPHVASFIHASPFTDSRTLALIDLYGSSTWLTVIPLDVVLQHSAPTTTITTDGTAMATKRSSRSASSASISRLSALSARSDLRRPWGLLAPRCHGPPITELTISYHARAELPPAYLEAHVDPPPRTSMTCAALIALFPGLRRARLRVVCRWGARALVCAVWSSEWAAHRGEEGVVVLVRRTRRIRRIAGGGGASGAACR